MGFKEGLENFFEGETKKSDNTAQKTPTIKPKPITQEELEKVYGSPPEEIEKPAKKTPTKPLNNFDCCNGSKNYIHQYYNLDGVFSYKIKFGFVDKVVKRTIERDKSHFRGLGYEINYAGNCSKFKDKMVLCLKITKTNISRG